MRFFKKREVDKIKATKLLEKHERKQVLKEIVTETRDVWLCGYCKHEWDIKKDCIDDYRLRDALFKCEKCGCDICFFCAIEYDVWRLRSYTGKRWDETGYSSGGGKTYSFPVDLPFERGSKYCPECSALIEVELANLGIKLEVE